MRFPTNPAKRKSFTLIEFMIGGAILSILLLIIGSAVSGPFLRKYTENQANQAMDAFISKAGIQDVSRKSCAGDSDGDGYGTCTIVCDSGEKIFLMCPVGLFNMASSCKEVPSFQMMNFGNQQ